MSFCFSRAAMRRFLVDDALLAVAVSDRVVDHRRLHVEGQLQQPGAVGPRRAEFGRGGDRRLGGVAGVEAPDGIFFQVGDGDRRSARRGTGRPRMPGCRFPVSTVHRDWRRCRRAARPRAARPASALTLRAYGGTGRFGGGELGADVAGEIGVGGLPGSGLAGRGRSGRPVRRQSALSACRRGCAMNGRSTAPRWLRETSNPSSALLTCVTGGVLPTTSLSHDGGFGRLAGRLRRSPPGT